MSEFKPILAIETSEKLCSAAIMLAENDFIEFSIQRKNIHSEKLMDMITILFDNSLVKLNEIAHIAVSIGPGSFTGLRIGLSVAKGLAYGTELPIVPVPNFDALALQISNNLKLNDKIVIANKANMNELYVGRYKVTENYFEQTDDTSLQNLEEFSNSLNEDDNLFGNYLQKKSLNITASPSAINVAKWSYIFGKDLVTYDHEFLEPNYLKKFIAKVKK